MAVSTSVKPLVSKPDLQATIIRPRARSTGRRSAWTCFDQSGEAEGGEDIVIRAGLCDTAGDSLWDRYGAVWFITPCIGRDATAINQGFHFVRVIASSVRKGNIIEHEDGQLYAVLSAESFHPGKGTPTTQIDMRRISDGVKTQVRYKTTENVERAFVEDKDHSFLYSDGDGNHFMNSETYDQVNVNDDVLGDQKVYLQEGMKVLISMFNGNAVAIQLPARIILEIVETEPAMKGQTASSSFKPAKLSNGARTMVPPHVQTGTRVVIQTEDGSYVERAKD